MTTKANDHFETLAIHAGQHPDPTTGAVMTPVYLTSTYAQSGPGEHKGFEYSRTRNPTRDALQGCLAALENGKHALAFASGLAATDAVLHLLSAGDHIVLSDDLYGGTFRLADKVFKRLGIEQTYGDVTDPRAVEGANVAREHSPRVRGIDVIPGGKDCQRKAGVLEPVDRLAQDSGAAPGDALEDWGNRGPSTHEATNCAFMAATTCPQPRVRATRWATNTCSRPSSRTSPRSTATRTASGERSLASSPGPPSVRHRSPPTSPSTGNGRPSWRACSITARACASDRTTTPSSGNIPGSP